MVLNTISSGLQEEKEGKPEIGHGGVCVCEIVIWKRETLSLVFEHSAKRCTTGMHVLRRTKRQSSHVQVKRRFTS
jgi:hypothetical protein